MMHSSTVRPKYIASVATLQNEYERFTYLLLAMIQQGKILFV